MARKALGIEIWNFEDRVAVSAISYQYGIDQHYASKNPHANDLQ